MRKDDATPLSALQRLHNLTEALTDQPQMEFFENFRLAEQEAMQRDSSAPPKRETPILDAIKKSLNEDVDAPLSLLEKSNKGKKDL